MVCSERAKLWLEVLSVGGVGGRVWIRLSRMLGLDRIVGMLRSRNGRGELGRLIGRAVAAPDGRFVDTQLAMLLRGCGRIVSVDDREYPELLRRIDDQPPILFYRSNLQVLENPSLCIVGSRRAGRRGKLTAETLAFELSRRGFTVVSGMARGVDGAAHAGALRGGGATCAVLGCGLDVSYPPEHAELAAQIASSGCLVSEYPFGTLPRRHHFPLRNRIMSGLSLGVVVVEADLDSGAMLTAHWAAQQGREVFAVPGPIDHALSRGPHRLIREGACLVECVDDILDALPPCGRVVARLAPSGSDVDQRDLSPDTRRVLSSLDCEPKHVDEIVQICHISAKSLLPILLDLEIRGLVVSCDGGTYALAGDALGTSTRG